MDELDPYDETWDKKLRKAELNELGGLLVEAKTALIKEIASGCDGVEWCLKYSNMMDGFMRRLFDIAVAETRKQMPDNWSSEPRIAVIATGGYGRRELSPFSDVDVTFVPYRDGDPFIDLIIRRMYQSLMDVVMTKAKIQVGYAYRLHEDFPELDAKTRTGLVDMRLIAGSRAEYERFFAGFWAYLRPGDFIYEKVAEYEPRLLKFGNTPFLAEPNIKEGAGGLRDYHQILWMASAAFHSEQSLFDALVRRDILSKEEAHQAQSAFAFLTRVRNHLHEQAGTAQDLLTRSRQAVIARAFGYHELPSQSRAEPFMKDYFVHARNLYLISKKVKDAISNSRVSMGEGVYIDNGQIYFSTPDEPTIESVLRAFRLAQKHHLKLAPQCADVIKQIEPSVEHQAMLGQFMRHILSKPGNVATVLRMMSDYGALEWLLPEFQHVLELIPYDSSHEFSVGEHTIRAIEYLDKLANYWMDEVGLYSEVLLSLAHPEVVYLALLLHDVGKSDPNRPHAEIGAEIAMQTVNRWAWEPDKRDNVAWLVKHHLLMAETARQRDLSLDSTISEFTAVVDDVERLQMLFVMTYADTNAVGRQIWTQVQSHFMIELYRRAMRRISSDYAEPQDIGGFKRRLLRELSPKNTDPKLVEEHIQLMPPNYLLNTARDQMALHIAYVERAKNNEPVLDFYHPASSAHTELTIVTKDDPEPGLLSKITGVLYALDIDVHGARVFTRKGEQPIAIDTLWVDYRGRQLSTAKSEEVKRVLTDVLKGIATLSAVFEKYKKNLTAPQPAYKVTTHSAEPDRMTVVDIQTPVGRGSLYRISRTLSELGWNIHSARLGLWAGRSVTSFYVTDSTDGVIDDSEAKALVDRLPTVEIGSHLFGE